MVPCPSAFVTLSAFQVGGIIAITLAAIALGYLLGLDEGKYRGRRELTRDRAWSLEDHE